MQNKPDLESLCKSVCELSKEVGSFIKGEINQLSNDQIETKALNSLVSYVDKSAEEKIVKQLSLLLPEAGFIAEEGSSTKKGETYNWIIDPLDGTTNFIHGLPVYSVSIALERDGQIILGVVYEINQQECFFAWENSRAFLNDKTIKVSQTKNLGDALMATGFPYYDFKRLDPYFELLKHLAQNTRGIRRMGSAAVDLVYVACGRFDAFFEYSLNPWDVAAGAFIVKQAGGHVADFSGNENWLHGAEILASNELLKMEMQGLIGKYLKT